MNILVLNGSPKGERSNNLKITRAFLDGMCSKQRHNINIVNISEKDIQHCRGCFTCWTKTPGKCVIKDEMGELIEQYINADLIVWSFPLYYFGMPSKIKAFLGRTLPTSLPYMTINEDGTSGHPPRYDLSHQRYILISTCGFYTVKNNYDALFRQFEIMFGEKLTKIICPEGELFSIAQLEGRISEYLYYAKKAGEEFAENDRISILMVSGLSVLALLDVNATLIICSSYFLFGLMWLVSSFFKIPLSAYYSSHDYNGDEAFENPLFIKTNRILTTAWGLMYLIIATYSYFLMQSALSKYTGLINALAPSLMGLFTLWFSKWYPAKVARG
jgi:multimeric flavodoxin WrbA